MAHKELYNVDEYGNKGWNAMHDILDKEMPVRKKKKKGIIYWWIGSAAAVTLLLIMIVQLGSKTSLDDTVVSKNEIQIKDYPRMNEVAAQSNDASENKNKKSENINNQPQASKLITATKISNDNKSIQQGGKSNHPIIKPIPNPIIISKTIHPDQYSNKLPSLTDSPLQKQNTVIRNLEPSVVAHAPIDNLNKIRSMDTSPFYLHQLTTNALKIPVQKNTTRLNFVEVGINESTKGNYSNINFKYQKGFELNKLWNIYLGIGYTLRSNAYNASLGENLAMAVSGSSNTSGMFFSAHDIESRKDAIHSLSFHSGISHDLSTRLSANIGGDIRFLTISQEKLDGIFLPLANPGNPTEESFSQYRLSSRAKVGLSYKLNDRLAIAGSYNYLLNNRKELNSIIPDFYTDEIGVSLQYMLD